MPPLKRPTDDDSSVLPRNKHPRLDDDDEEDDATVVVSDDDDDNDDATVDLCWVDTDEQDVAGVPVLRVVMSNKTPLGDTSRAAAVIARNPIADFICLVFKQGGGLPTDDGTLRRHTPSSHTLVHTTTDRDGTAVCGIFQRGCAWQWLGELVPYLYHMRHRRTGTDITIANVFFPRGQPASESEAGVQRLALSVWHQRLRTFVVESRTVHEDGTVSAVGGIATAFLYFPEAPHPRTKSGQVSDTPSTESTRRTQYAVGVQLNPGHRFILSRYDSNNTI